MIKLAIATDDGEVVSERPFTVAKRFKVYEINEAKATITLIDDRENALNVQEAESEIEYCRQLLEKVLNDINVIIGSSATHAGYRFFMLSGVQVLFVDPNTPINAIVEYIRRALKESSSQEM